MRQCILMVALLGCAHAAPPWPKPSVSDIDGGESLAPRETKTVTVAKNETAPDAKPDLQTRPPADAKPTVTPPATSAPAPPPTAPPLLEEPEEETIVIEIED